MFNHILFNMKLAALLLALAPFAALAQTKPAPLLPPADANIQKLVDEISAKNLEADIRKLVSFGTRHTLSDTQSPTRGIGAARNWVKGRV